MSNGNKMEINYENEATDVKNKLFVNKKEQLGIVSEKPVSVETSHESTDRDYDEEIPLLNLILPDFRSSETYKLFQECFTEESFKDDNSIAVLRNALNILFRLCSIINTEAETYYGYKPSDTIDYELHGYSSYEQAIREESSEFYHLFSDYLNKDEPKVLIDTQEKVSEKLDLLFILKDYDNEAYKYLGLKTSYGEDSLYVKQGMQFEFKPLKSESEIVKSIKNSLHYTSGLFPIQLVRVYGYNNKRSSNAIEPRLLWHGTALENMTSILKEGLKIGSAYNSLGRALYFSESVKTPAFYCKPNKGSCERLLLLCEVDIGKPYVVNGDLLDEDELYDLDEAPEDCDTVHHRTSPINMNHFNCHTDENGARFFDGKLQTGKETLAYERTKEGRLGYSQQAVYDEDRVKIRYVVHVRFNEK